ncbi:hypothetical protein MRX96_005234 [Rhipicephalus microplus]
MSQVQQGRCHVWKRRSRTLKSTGSSRNAEACPHSSRYCHRPFREGGGGSLLSILAPNGGVHYTACPSPARALPRLRGPRYRPTRGRRRRFPSPRRCGFAAVWIRLPRTVKRVEDKRIFDCSFLAPIFIASHAMRDETRNRVLVIAEATEPLFRSQSPLLRRAVAPLARRTDSVVYACALQAVGIYDQVRTRSGLPRCMREKVGCSTRCSQLAMTTSGLVRVLACAFPYGAAYQWHFLPCIGAALSFPRGANECYQRMRDASPSSLPEWLTLDTARCSVK